MTVKIRLARAGSKKRPQYRVVVANSSAPRDGKFIEKVGIYHPLLAKEDPERFVIKSERVLHWMSVGAKPTQRVAKLMQLKDLPEISQSKSSQKTLSTKTS